MIATTSAATSPGLASPLLNVEELSTHAPRLLHCRAHTTVEVSEDCDRVDDVARKERVENVDCNSSSALTDVIACMSLEGSAAFARAESHHLAGRLKDAKFGGPAGARAIDEIENRRQS